MWHADLRLLPGALLKIAIVHMTTASKMFRIASAMR